MQCVVLAGGLATRLGARAARTPKFLVEVAGRPFAAWLLERLARAGYDEVLLLIGHLGEAVAATLGDGRAFGVRLRYRSDGPALCGTGGALRQALDALAPRFLLTYGDSYLPFDYAEPLADLAAHPEALGTMAVYRNDNRFDRSNVRLADAHPGLVAEYRELAPGVPPDPALAYIDYGATALCREAVARIAPGQAAAHGALFAALAGAGLLRALAVSTRFFEIGSEAGLAELALELAPRRGTP